MAEQVLISPAHNGVFFDNVEIILPVGGTRHRRVERRQIPYPAYRRHLPRPVEFVRHGYEIHRRASSGNLFHRLAHDSVRRGIKIVLVKPGEYFHRQFAVHQHAAQKALFRLDVVRKRADNGFFSFFCHNPPIFPLYSDYSKIPPNLQVNNARRASPAGCFYINV